MQHPIFNKILTTWHLVSGRRTLVLMLLTKNSLSFWCFLKKQGEHILIDKVAYHLLLQQESSVLFPVLSWENCITVLKIPKLLSNSFFLIDLKRNKTLWNSFKVNVLSLRKLTAAVTPLWETLIEIRILSCIQDLNGRCFGDDWSLQNFFPEVSDKTEEVENYLIKMENLNPATLFRLKIKLKT